MRLGFYQPDIPQNLGASLRLAACFGVGIDIIEPCGFPLNDRALRRSAMDYGEAVDVVRHSGWASFTDSPARRAGRLVLFTTASEFSLDAFAFLPGDILLFGRESAGAPPEVHAEADARVRIPVSARSLNIVAAAAIALWEARRQGAIASEAYLPST